MLQNSNSEVKFTCSTIDDKLSIKKYCGPNSEDCIFFRKEFKAIETTCKWTDAQGVIQLQRALNGQALQVFLDQNPYENTKQAFDILLNHFVGADAYRRYHQLFRTAKQSQDRLYPLF